MNHLSLRIIVSLSASLWAGCTVFPEPSPKIAPTMGGHSTRCTDLAEALRDPIGDGLKEGRAQFAKDPSTPAPLIKSVAAALHDPDNPHELLPRVLKALNEFGVNPGTWGVDVLWTNATDVDTPVTTERANSLDLLETGDPRFTLDLLFSRPEDRTKGYIQHAETVLFRVSSAYEPNSRMQQWSITEVTGAWLSACHPSKNTVEAMTKPSTGSSKGPLPVAANDDPLVMIRDIQSLTRIDLDPTIRNYEYLSTLHTLQQINFGAIQQEEQYRLLSYSQFPGLRLVQFEGSGVTAEHIEELALLKELDHFPKLKCIHVLHPAGNANIHRVNLRIALKEQGIAYFVGNTQETVQQVLQTCR